MIEIKRYKSRIEAELDRSLLEASGIPCHVAHDDAGGLSPHLALGGFFSRLYILNPEDEDDARKILNYPKEIA